MDPWAREWVEMAEADASACEHLLGTLDAQIAGVIGFHAQQCAEKYLKARLQVAQLSVPRTHDLSLLLDLVVAVEPAWESYRAELDFLVDFAVSRRYPGGTVSWQDAEQAVLNCRRFRAAARQSLQLAT